LTDERESSVPLTLVVAVKNDGYGTAFNLRITSAQPEIIENEKGLLVNFKIIGANVGNKHVSPSLTVNFDDITPRAAKVARWYTILNLQGEFKNYSATFENVNPLGDIRLSILDDLQIHELYRNVHIYTGEDDDEILDFLVKDSCEYPNAVYDSKTLQRFIVTAGDVLSVQTVEDGGTLSLEVLTSSNSSGWAYFMYEDTQGLFSTTLSAVNITKHEGDQIYSIPSENSWITRDRQHPMNNTQIRPTFYLHIFGYAQDTDIVMYTLNHCDSDCPVAERPYIPIVTVATPTSPATTATLSDSTNSC